MACTAAKKALQPIISIGCGNWTITADSRKNLEPSSLREPPGILTAGRGEDKAETLAPADGSAAANLADATTLGLKDIKVLGQEAIGQHFITPKDIAADLRTTSSLDFVQDAATYVGKEAQKREVVSILLGRSKMAF